MVIDPCMAFVQHMLDLFGIAVQKVQPSGQRLKPGPSIDPRTPLVKVSHGWGMVRDRELLDTKPNRLDVGSRSLRVVDSDVYVGIWPCGSSRVGTASNNSRDSPYPG